MDLRSSDLTWFSDAGKRPENEDCSGTTLAKNGLALLVVADGMGGHACGEVASRLVVDFLLSSYEAAGYPNDADTMARLIREAHQTVLTAASEDKEKNGMGSTVVVVLAMAPTEKSPGRAIIGHVGDSRATQFRGNCTRRLTRDHLFAVEVLGVPEELGKHHARGNILSQALGSGGDVTPEIHEWDLEAGDVIILCSDGVTEVITELDMHKAIQVATQASDTDPSLEDLASQLVREATEGGSRDNCTVAILRIPVEPGGAAEAALNPVEQQP